MRVSSSLSSRRARARRTAPGVSCRDGVRTPRSPVTDAWLGSLVARPRVDTRSSSRPAARRRAWRTRASGCRRRPSSVSIPSRAPRSPDARRSSPALPVLLRRWSSLQGGGATRRGRSAPARRACRARRPAGRASRGSSRRESSRTAAERRLVAPPRQRRHVRRPLGVRAPLADRELGQLLERAPGQPRVEPEVHERRDRGGRAARPRRPSRARRAAGPRAARARRRRSRAAAGRRRRARGRRRAPASRRRPRPRRRRGTTPSGSGSRAPMCGRSARTMRSSSSGGRVGSSMRSRGSIFCA